MKPGKLGHAMLDLETLSLKPDSMILSAGIVAFCPELGVGPGIEVVFDLEQQIGRHIDADTVSWWVQQTQEARQVFISKRVPVNTGLFLITNFIHDWTTGPETVQFWGNGSDFDNVLFANFWHWASRKFGIGAQPWNGKNNRCFRTLKNLRPGFREIMDKPRKIWHNALDDARWQAECAVEMLRQIK